MECWNIDVALLLLFLVYCPFEVLKNWLILVVRPLLMSVSFVVFVFHACLSCCYVVEFVLMCCVCCCCCSVKEGCRRIFPFSSFICGCFHGVILFWIHSCLHTEFYVDLMEVFFLFLSCSIWHLLIPFFFLRSCGQLHSGS